MNEKFISSTLANRLHPKIKAIVFHKYLHFVMLGLTIIAVTIGVTIQFRQRTKDTAAATFTKTWTSYNDFNYANGVSGTTSTASGVTLNGSGTPTDANAGNVILASTSSSKTQTSETDFNGGTFNQATISGTGTGANVVLTTGVNNSAQTSSFNGGAAIREDISTGADEASISTVDANYLYVSGWDTAPGNNEWRIEKRDKTTGALVSAFGIDGVVTSNQSSGSDIIYALVADSNYLYAGGRDYVPGNGEWRIEKRDKTTGALVSAFGTGGVVTVNPSGTNDVITTLAIDSSYLYVGGSDGSVGLFQWRVEKRDLSTGALVSAFGTGGVVTVDPSAGVDSLWSLVVDSAYIYFAGRDNSPGGSDYEWRIEKRDITTGALVSAFGTNGVVIANPSSSQDIIKSVVVDSTYLYLGGSDSFQNSAGNDEWRIEKRDKTTGALVSAFGTGGVVTTNPSSGTDLIYSLAMDSGYLYAGGQDSSPGGSASEWRLEKRDLTTGALAANFGTNGVITVNQGSGLTTLFNVLVDSGYLYLIGNDSLPGNDEWRIEKRGPGYNTSGSFTSGAIDLGQNSNFTTLAFTTTVSASTTATFQLRSATSSGALSSATWYGPTGASDSYATSGATINTIHNGDRFIQYQVSLTTTDTSQTPALSDITVNYAYYPTSGTISNLIFDATKTSSWLSLSLGAATPSATSVRFRVRTASTSGGLFSASWSAYLTTSGSSLTGQMDNQFLELEIGLVTTNQSQTPTLNEVTVSYVQNTPPVVATTAASLATDGTGIMTVNYTLSDSEDGLCTDSGVCNGADDGLVSVTIQYSTDNANWSSAATVSQSGQTVTAGVIALTGIHQSSTTYIAMWNVKTDLGSSLDQTNYYLRTFANDGNSLKNTTASAATTVVIDTKAPTSPSISITATSSVTISGTKRTNTAAVTLSLDATDNDSSKYLMLSTNDSSFTNSSWESYVATKSAYPLRTSSSNQVNTIYVKFKDSSGNVSAMASDVIVYDNTSPTPTSPKIADISDLANGNYRLILSWSKVGDPDNDFASYQVYRSTDSNSNGSVVATINNSNTTYYLDQGLTQNQRYYYKVGSVDQLNNASTLSSVISAAPSVGDISPPALSSNTTISISTTSTTATFTFYTSDVAYGYVDYWITDGTKKTLGEVDAVSSQNPHSITLTSLTSGTTYNYRVRATSVTNFEGKTKTSTLEENKTFTTSSNVTISNAVTVNIATSSVTVTWKTSENAGGEVDYGTTSALGSIGSESSTASNTDHSVLLTGLTPGTIYYYRVKSGNSSYPETNSSPSSFTTASLAKASTTPPNISGTGPTVTALSTSVTVTWNTDKVSDSYVEYGLTASYGTNTGLDESTLSHSVTVTGLTPSTTYHFRVKSKDSDGNTGTSNDSTFTTKDKSVITEVTISDISLNSAILSWTTNVISKSNVKIGTKINSYDKEIQEESTDKTLNHVARIKDLAEGTKYFLRIVGTDGDGNNITSDDYPFSTISKPIITNVKVKGTDDHSVTITWQTNVPSDATISYGKTQDKLDTDKGKSDQVTSHEIKLTNLDDNTKYYYLVKSRDKFGNLGEGEVKEVTTSTDTTPPAISEVKSEASLVGSGETSRIQIIVSWSTDEPATSQVDYDEGIGLGNSIYSNHTTQDSTLNQSHIVIISGLKPSTTYHFRVVSKDKIGNQSQSTEYTVLTPPKDVSTLQLILKSWEETFTWVQNLKKVIPLWPF
ncbi:MAG: fibronectin type III domain-containing protein [Patescibacteria group bacterium]|nr:fibronectin type III domain-containing protein [Patescibacteria group bacterium]